MQHPLGWVGGAEEGVVATALVAEAWHQVAEAALLPGLSSVAVYQYLWLLCILLILVLKALMVGVELNTALQLSSFQLYGKVDIMTSRLCGLLYSQRH